MLFRKKRIICLYLIFARLNLHLQEFYVILNTYFLLIIKNVMFSMTSRDIQGRETT